MHNVYNSINLGAGVTNSSDHAPVCLEVKTGNSAKAWRLSTDILNPMREQNREDTVNYLADSANNQMGCFERGKLIG